MAQLLNLNQRLHQMAVDTAKRDIKANGIDIEELRTAADRAGVALQPAGFERAKANFNAGRTPIAGAMDFIEFFATSDQMLAVVNQVASARLKQQQQQEIVGLSDDIDQLRAELQELMKDPTAFQQFLEQHGKKLAVAAAGAALGTAFYLANPAGVQSFANDIFQSMEYEWKNHPERLKGRVDQLASVVRLASKASGMGGVDNGTMASPLDMVAVGLMELSTSGALNIQEIMQKVESLAVVVSQELGGDGKNTAQLVPVGRLQRILQEEMATNPALREYPFMQDIMALNPADALPLGLIQARIDGNQELTLDALRLEMMAPEMIERALAQRSMGEKVGDTVNSWRAKVENLSSALVQVAGDQLQLNVMKLKVSAEMYAKDIGGALEQGAGLLGVVREEHQENTPDKQAAAEQAVLEGAFATDRGRREITQVAADIPALKPGINPA